MGKDFIYIILCNIFLKIVLNYLASGNNNNLKNKINEFGFRKTTSWGK